MCATHPLTVLLSLTFFNAFYHFLFNLQKLFEPTSSKFGRGTFMLLQQSIHGKPADYINCLSFEKGDFPKPFVFG